MKPVIVTASAERDLLEAADFYDLQEPGVGAYFEDLLLADIEELSTLHGLHPRRFGFYKMLAAKFPHGIYYQDLTDSVRVIAVLDLRRDPRWIRTQLQTRKHHEP